MDTSYYIVDTPATANYSANTYYQVYVNAGDTLIYKGTTFAPTGGPITLNLTVNSVTDVGGSDATIILMGKKQPQAFAVGPPGQGGVNTDGTWNIKG